MVLVDWRGSLVSEIEPLTWTKAFQKNICGPL